jgi:hypothetical protein
MACSSDLWSKQVNHRSAALLVPVLCIEMLIEAPEEYVRVVP